MLLSPELCWISSNSFFIFSWIIPIQLFFWAWTEWILCCYRWESYRTGCGPQTGAERVRRGVCLPAKACGFVSNQCQDFLDCELKTWLMKNSPFFFQSQLEVCGGHANLWTLTSKNVSNRLTRSSNTTTSAFRHWSCFSCSSCQCFFRSHFSLATFKVIVYFTGLSAAPGWSRMWRPRLTIVSS